MLAVTKAAIRSWVWIAVIAATFGFWLGNIMVGFFMLLLLLFIETLIRTLTAAAAEQIRADTAKDLKPTGRAERFASGQVGVEHLPGNVERLQSRAAFQPYCIGIHFNTRTLPELLQKLRFLDGERWINGVKWSEAVTGLELWRGIRFLVLSITDSGNPELVYRTDGREHQFQLGLHELSRVIAEASPLPVF